MNINWMEVLNSVIYGGIGLVFMLVGVWLFDLLVPYNFNKELKEKNVSAGYIMAGIFIAIAIIIRTIIK